MGETVSLFLLLFFSHLLIGQANTATQDYTALLTLMAAWENTPPNWVGSDPCGGWDGIECTNSRITSISLASMDLSGQLTSDIGLLSELLILDLSYNRNLTGPLPSNIGNLRKLRNLLLISCGFTGPIPATIGNLERLVFLSLNSNGFSGPIPAAIGNLSNLYWLDLAENQLEGPIPISNGTTPGLDMMHHTKHFHFGRNKLSGDIPAQLFSSEMSLIHVLFETNRFTGSIPSTLGLVKSLEVVRFDDNFLSGSLPQNISNLTSVRELFLSKNRLSGSLPDLTGMNSLSYLMMEDTKLEGAIPVSLFNLQQLQTVVLKNNKLNGTLDIGTFISNQLDLLDLQLNYIEKFEAKVDVSKVEIILLNNPICQETGVPQSYCSITKSNDSYSTPPENCVPVPCSSDQTLSPKCKCAYPYTGTLFLRAPSFSDLGNQTVFVTLQLTLMQSFQVHNKPVDSVSLSNPRKNIYQYLELTLKLFPSGQDRFNRTGISSIAFLLSNQTYKPPSMFGPYYFIADDYENYMNDTVLEGPVTTSSKSSNTGIIAGAAAGGAALLVLVLVLFVYALHRKNKSVRATGKNNPFEQWDPDESNSSIPQLKGARRFNFEEIQICTKNFSQVNNIGSGGYGKEAIDKTKGFCGLEEVLDPTIDFGTALNGFEKFVDIALQCVEESSSDRPTMNYVVKEIENMLQLAGSSPILSASASTSSSYNNPMKSSLHPYENEYFDSSVVLPLCKYLHFKNVTSANNVRIGFQGKFLRNWIFGSNQLVGSIPETLALVTSLTLVRFENNSLDGYMPLSLNNLINVTDLLLSNNKLHGALPNLTGMNSLKYLLVTKCLSVTVLDLTNNGFDKSSFPLWLSNLKNLTTFVLKDNRFAGTLDIGTNYCKQLQLIDLTSNSIEDFKQRNDSPQIRITLEHNPICTETEIMEDYCTNLNISHTKPQNSCQQGSCSPDQILSPKCKCGYPYTGTLTCRAPSYFES
ncbi:hypothetical protein ACSQ67_012512 [Phaseolus vulgaris]